MENTLEPWNSSWRSVSWRTVVPSIRNNDEQPGFYRPARKHTILHEALRRMQEESERELIAAAHRAEQDFARQKERYAYSPIWLLPHAALLRESWAMKQLRALPDGTPRRAGTLPRLKWTGGGISPRWIEHDGNARQYTGKKRFL